jgi:type IV pilus biogenesis protein CpaD/CtpE
MKRLLAILLLALAGCASLGLEPPQTFEDRLAYAYGTNTALREASISALDARTITSTDMGHIMSVNGQVRVLLDQARSFSGTDVSTAEGRLLAATKLLTELQNYLRARGVKTSYFGGDPCLSISPCLS